MDAKLIDKLKKILALTGSPVEAEAQAAAEHLQRLLTAHNLQMADLEAKGAAKPNILKSQYDLGKAAFKWKLQLAEVMADHYFCYPLVDNYTKTVYFVGRPDNVDSLLMLYGWVMDQIKRLSTETWRENEKIEHVDPLRWQVNFGLGVTSRMATRLYELARQRTSETTALVVHHKSEIADWFESTYGYRTDGQETAAVKARREADEKLKAEDPEAFYDKYPWMRPKTDAERAAMEAQAAKRNAEWEKRQERNERRRQNRESRPRWITQEEAHRREQAGTARQAGRDAAHRVNLQPFVDGTAPRRRVLP